MDAKLLQVIYHTVQNYNIFPLTSVCNVRCLFCSHQQNPPGIRAIGVPHLPLELVEDLLLFFDKEKKIVIGESASLIMEGEPFTHPHFWDCLDMIRRKFPYTPIQITTNGSFLDEETVEKLPKYNPLEVNLSLNITGATERSKLMGDRNASIACQAPELLKKYGINYHGSIVAMPHITGWPALYATLKLLSENNAQTIRVFKPGFTKYAPQELIINPDILDELASKIKEWRHDLCPITLEPQIITDLQARVVGIIKNSPASFAGIKSGDIIKSINGKTPFSRVEAFQKLQLNGRYSLVIERGGEELTIELEVVNGKSGLVFDYDISREDIESIIETINKYKSTKPLLLASELGYNVLQIALKDIPDIEIVPVQNEFFEGNIQSAGLLVVEDMLKALQNYQKINRAPDLVLVPGQAFDLNERDLAGTGIWQLEEAAKCSVVLA